MVQPQQPGGPPQPVDPNAPPPPYPGGPPPPAAAYPASQPTQQQVYTEIVCISISWLEPLKFFPIVLINDSIINYAIVQYIG